MIEVVEEIEEKGVKPISISDEMRGSFLDYAMSVIASRALPDARDGLKPVHRRIMYAMNDLGITHDKPHKKSARIVGEVIGKYHPHGDTSVYDTMVRMAQDFSYRYMLVDGHGNFGSVDGDRAAAMRYTEARMSKIAGELVRDIKKDTIDFRENYDGQELEPSVLPSAIPHLLLNGSTGIAVGMATNIPPHNLSEVVDGLIMVAKDPEVSIMDIKEVIKGPDFPTGGEILGDKGISLAFQTGHGSIKIRAKSEVKEIKGKNTIIITELPYQVNKARLIQKIAILVRDKKISGITDLRDETSRKGMRIIIELKQNAVADVVLNKLYKLTPMQSSFGVNMLALVKNRPICLTIKQSLEIYLKHQYEVLVRKTKFDLKKADDRLHILEGLLIALSNINQVIEIIKKSENTHVAADNLIAKFNMSSEQAKAIIDMRLGRLTGLEQDKIAKEATDLKMMIAEYNSILESKDKQTEIIITELLNIKEKYGDKRRTKIVYGIDEDIDNEDLIPKQQVVISISNKGYCKSIALSEYRVQNRGGVGSRSMRTNDGDFVEHMMLASTHTDILMFTNKGKVYRLRGHEIPILSKTSKGIPAINLISIEKGERVEAMIKVDKYVKSNLFTFVTKQGLIKVTTADMFNSIRQTGKVAIKLKDGDELVAVRKSKKSDTVLMANQNGKAIRFCTNEVRPSGRSAAGVKGMSVGSAEIIGFAVSSEAKYILSITENGYGKLTPLDKFRTSHRGGKGVISQVTNEKTGNLVKIRAVNGIEDLLVVTTSGISVRTKLEQISISGRSTMGVKIIDTKSSKVASISIIPSVKQVEAEAKGQEIKREMTEEELEQTRIIDMNELTKDE